MCHSGKTSACQCRRLGFNPWVAKIPWRRKWQPIPIFLPGKFHGQRSLASYSLSGCKELETAEHTCILPRFTSSNILSQRTFSSSPNKEKKKFFVFCFSETGGSHILNTEGKNDALKIKHLSHNRHTV